MNLRLKVFLIGAGLMVGVGLPASHFLARSSEAFSISRYYFEHNPALITAIGEVADVRLVFLRPLTWTAAGSSGFAHFEVQIVGSRATRDGIVELKKHKDQWTVVSAEVSGVGALLSPTEAQCP